MYIGTTQRAKYLAPNHCLAFGNDYVLIDLFSAIPDSNTLYIFSISVGFFKSLAIGII